MRWYWLAIVAVVGCGTSDEDRAPDTEAPCTEQTWAADRDGDGFGDRNDTVKACDVPDGYISNGSDCDDSDAAVHPNADELCDGVDNSCSGEVDDNPIDPNTFYFDADLDGVGDGDVTATGCEAPYGYLEQDGDCDDADPLVFPGATEICDGIDNDCDGTLPDDEADLDADGYIACLDDCDDDDVSSFPGASEVCDGADNDCDSVIDNNPVDGTWWFEDLDGDGYGDLATGVRSCSPIGGWILDASDCNDLNAGVHPGAVEVVGDGVDEDCDGIELCFEDGDGDGVGGLDAVPAPAMNCTDPGLSSTSDDCDDGDPDRFPGNGETPYDNIDNDCDAATPDDDIDGDGFLAADDCDDDDPLVFPDPFATPAFEEISLSAGISALQWDVDINPFECFPFMNIAAGAAIADFDEDGLEDLLLTRLQLPDLLYQNQGDGTFVDVAVARGIDHTGTSSAAKWLDVDGDADLDLFVASAGMEDSRLYINDGAGFFTEEATVRGATTPRAGPMACSDIFGISGGDYDGDGDLDLHTDAWYMEFNPYTSRNLLLDNDGAGNFTDVTIATGLDMLGIAGFASSWVDVDDDGDLELAVSADWGTSILFDNQGNGSFTDVTAIAGLTDIKNGMGSDWADYDRDGDLDWFTTGIYFPGGLVCPGDCDGNRLYANDGAGNFTNVTDAAGLANGGWGWGATFFDYDNDGDLDLGTAEGAIDPTFVFQRNRLYANDGSGVYDDKACELGLDHIGNDRAFLPFDLENDGDLDILVTSSVDPPRLYRNLADGANSWIRIQLYDPTSPTNPRAIGATVTIQPQPGADIQRADLHLNEQFGGQRPAEAHFGFGAYQGDLFQVSIKWPNGNTDVLFDVPPRQVLLLDRSLL